MKPKTETGRLIEDKKKPVRWRTCDECDGKGKKPVFWGFTDEDED